MGRIFGIDLGTSSCSISEIAQGETRILPAFDGKDEMPTYVSFLPDGGKLIGWAAKRQSVTNPQDTVFTIKRLIGRSFDSKTVQAELGLLPYKVIPSASGGMWVEACGRAYSPAEITAMMLGEVKRAAEAYLGEPVDKAVITVPAFFGRVQRKATKEAARIAGIEAIRLVPEPVAAALAYGVAARDELVAVYDLGGGTFDVSLLEIGGSGTVNHGVFDTRAVNGDNLLGGEDFDHALVRHFAEHIKARHGLDIAADPLALHRVKDAAEQIKMTLDRAQIAHADLPYFAFKDGEPVHVALELTRTRLDEIVAPLIERTLGPCREALKDAGLKPEQIQRVLLVGGMSRMPAVQRQVESLFQRKPDCHQDPSRVVAMGAAVQAGVLGGDRKNTVLLDVTPRSIGFESEGGVQINLVERNTTLPTKRGFSVRLEPNDPGSPELPVLLARGGRLDLFEGERDRVGDNDWLGAIDLAPLGLLPPKAVLEITLDIDANDTLSVEIKRGADVLRQRVEPQVIGAPEGAQRAAQIAPAAAPADIAAAKDRAEALILAVDAAMKGAGSYLAGETRTHVEDARDNLLRALQSRDPSELAPAVAALEQTSGVRAPDQAKSAPAATALSAHTGRACVFISYAHEDSDWLARLRVHLRPLERLGAVEIWHDRKMQTGVDWRAEIDQALSRASAAVLLVSAHFLASDFIYEHELPPLLDKHAAARAAILPVFIGPCYFDRDPFLTKLNAFNDPVRPLKGLSEADAEAELARLTKSIWERVG